MDIFRVPKSEWLCLFNIEVGELYIYVRVLTLSARGPYLYVRIWKTVPALKELKYF